MTITAVATHTAMAAAAIAAPGLARMLPQLTRLITCDDSATQVDSARETTRRRLATASSASEKQRSRTSFLSSGGSAGSGIKPERMVGRSAPPA